MKKVTNLESYKHILLKREGDLKASKGLIDEDADYEDFLFDWENRWDLQLDHGDRGFVQRQNSNPELIYLQGKFCQFVQYKKKDGKEALEASSKDTALSRCFLVEFTGIYEGFHENGSLEINAEFANGLLHGRFMHLNTAFKKIREYDFYKGKKHGLGVIYKKDGTNRVSSVTPWRHGFRDGEVMRYNDEEIQKLTTFSYKGGELYETSK
tara:strand:- start:1765 stop:2394 length:630 start_codon:yes stop_codon:yes gene_type:complete